MYVKYSFKPSKFDALHRWTYFFLCPKRASHLARIDIEIHLIMTSLYCCIMAITSFRGEIEKKYENMKIILNLTK